MLFRSDDETKNVTDVSANNGQTFTVDGNITVTVTNTLKLTQLHIKKTGMETGESAIFTVTGKGIENGLTVVVPNGQTVTIDGVFVGETYTVSEMDGWTWKYSVTGASSISKVLISATSETDNLFSFENELSNDHWLSGEGRKINVFRKAAPPDGTTD